MIDLFVTIFIIFILLATSAIGYCRHLHKILNYHERLIKKLESNYNIYVNMHKSDHQIWGETEKNIVEKFKILEFKVNEMEKTMKSWIKGVYVK